MTADDGNGRGRSTTVTHEVPNRARFGRRSLLLTPLALTALVACSQTATPPPPPPPPPATSSDVAGTQVDVRKGDLIESIIVNASLTPARETALFFRQSGRLKNLTTTSGE
jgi:hypothetical protein